MPEDRSKTFKNLPAPSKTSKSICTCKCTPVGPAELEALFRRQRPSNLPSDMQCNLPRLLRATPTAWEPD
eukprot:10746713-Heterocapsa_arctica.AAC.1